MVYLAYSSRSQPIIVGKSGQELEASSKNSKNACMHACLGGFYTYSAQFVEWCHSWWARSNKDKSLAHVPKGQPGLENLQVDFLR